MFAPCVVGPEIIHPSAVLCATGDPGGPLRIKNRAGERHTRPRLE